MVDGIEIIGVGSLAEAVGFYCEQLAIEPATFRWDDVGAWEALTRTRPADSQGNVAVGKAYVVDGAGNVVFSEGGRVVVFGVDDLVVVRTDHVTMVTSRARSPALKDLLAKLPEDIVNPEAS